MNTQTNQNSVQPTLFEAVTAAPKADRKAAADGRKQIEREAFAHQTGAFKTAFEAFFFEFIKVHKKFYFEELTETYSTKKDLPQPKIDFRCVGNFTTQMRRRGIIRQIGTASSKCRRIVPLYEVV